MENEAMIYERLFATSYAQVLRFLARHVGQSFYEREIVESTDVSRSAVNLAANALYEAGFLRRERRGRMNFYVANDRHPFVRQFKILDTIALLEPLLTQLQPLSRRIVLFGSCAQGTDGADSDVDLFILTSDRSQVMTLISHNRLERPVQPVIVSNQELATMKQHDRAFYDQVQQGMVLWETVDGLAT
jgi:DNA-binding transcriptional ArsR family regulator